MEENVTVAKSGEDIAAEKISEEPGKYTRRLELIEMILTNWWDKWFVQVFSSLVPYKKWKLGQTNIEVRDIILAMYAR